MEKSKKKKALLAASVAGLMAMSGVAVIGAGNAHAGSDGMEHCYGINACKGTGACGGKGHSCAGKNGCEGAGFINVPEGTCTKIKGGSLTPIEG